MILYIRDPVSDIAKGLELILVFTFTQLIAQIFRKRYVTNAYIIALRLRRILVATLFDKVVRLSTQSISQTNSGKLISLISSDLLSVENGLSYFPIILVAPFVNLLAYYFLA
jgi:ABC-type multidrug transport system fused ATPase/permease subunit